MLLMPTNYGKYVLPARMNKHSQPEVPIRRLSSRKTLTKAQLSRVTNCPP